VLYLRARDRGACGYFDDARARHGGGWARLCEDLTVMDVPGDHFSVLRQPTADMEVMLEALKMELGAFGWGEVVRRERLPPPPPRLRPAAATAAGGTDRQKQQQEQGGGAAAAAAPGADGSGDDLQDYLARMGVGDAALRARLAAGAGALPMAPSSDALAAASPPSPSAGASSSFAAAALGGGGIASHGSGGGWSFVDGGRRGASSAWLAPAGADELWPAAVPLNGVAAAAAARLQACEAEAGAATSPPLAAPLLVVSDTHPLDPELQSALAAVQGRAVFQLPLPGNDSLTARFGTGPGACAALGRELALRAREVFGGGLGESKRGLPCCTVAGVGLAGAAAYELVRALCADGAGEAASGGGDASADGGGGAQGLNRRRAPHLLLLEPPALRHCADLAASEWLRLEGLLRALDPSGATADAFVREASSCAGADGGAGRVLHLALAACRRLGPQAPAHFAASVGGDRSWEALLERRLHDTRPERSADRAESVACWSSLYLLLEEDAAAAAVAAGLSPGGHRGAEAAPIALVAAPPPLSSAGGGRGGTSGGGESSDLGSGSGGAVSSWSTAAGGVPAPPAPPPPTLHAFLLQMAEHEADSEAQLELAARMRRSRRRELLLLRRRQQNGQRAGGADGGDGDDGDEDDGDYEQEEEERWNTRVVDAVGRAAWLSAAVASHAPSGAAGPTLAALGARVSLLHGAAHRSVRDLQPAVILPPGAEAAAAAAAAGAGGGWVAGSLRSVASLVQPARLQLWADGAPAARDIELALSWCERAAPSAAPALGPLLPASSSFGTAASSLGPVRLRPLEGGLALPRPSQEPLLYTSLPAYFMHGASGEVPARARRLARALRVPCFGVELAPAPASAAAAAAAFPPSFSAAAATAETSTTAAAAPRASSSASSLLFSSPASPVSPATRVQRAAARYASCLVSQQPCGPYVLVGVGEASCALAFAAACELETQGAEQGVCLLLVNGPCAPHAVAAAGASPAAGSGSSSSGSTGLSDGGGEAQAAARFARRRRARAALAHFLGPYEPECLLQGPCVVMTTRGWEEEEEGRQGEAAARRRRQEGGGGGGGGGGDDEDASQDGDLCLASARQLVAGPLHRISLRLPRRATAAATAALEADAALTALGVLLRRQG